MTQYFGTAFSLKSYRAVDDSLMSLQMPPFTLHMLIVSIVYTDFQQVLFNLPYESRSILRVKEVS